MPTDNELDRSFAKTGSIKMETPRNSIKSEIATIGTAYPTETEEPVAMADVAESSGPAITEVGGPVVDGTLFRAVADITGASGLKGTEAGDPVMTGTRFRTVPDVAGASGPAETGAGAPVVKGAEFRTVNEVAGASGPAGTGAGGPVVAGTRFPAVAEVYAPPKKTKGDLQGDVRRVDQNSTSPEEETGSIPLKHSGVVEGADISGGIRKRNTPESFEICTDPAPAGETSDEEPIWYSAHSGSSNGANRSLPMVRKIQRMETRLWWA